MPADGGVPPVKSRCPGLQSRVSFSGLDSTVAGEAEDDCANRGCVLVSNSRNHRMDPDVPLLIPELNADHIGAIDRQRKRRGGHGYIVTNPNCSVVGLALAIAPIERLYGIEAIHVTTMQAISGAGYNGVASYAIIDNVIPYIGGGEEGKIESEPRKILGRFENDQFIDAPFRISAQVNRVPTIDGHLMTISLGLRDRNFVNVDQVREAIDNFRGEPQHLRLTSSPSAAKRNRSSSSLHWPASRTTWSQQAKLLAPATSIASIKSSLRYVSDTKTWRCGSCSRSSIFSNHSSSSSTSRSIRS